MLKRFVVCLLLLFSVTGGAHASSRVPLRLHVWVDCFPAWVIDEFTKETGIPVLLSFFSDSESLRSALHDQGAVMRYDVVSPPADTIETLAAEKMIVPLDKEKIPNAQHMDPWFAELGYDPGNAYSVPLTWGILGIVIDRRVLPDTLTADILGYADLKKAELRGKLMLPNDFRTLLSIMLLTLHYSVNDTDPDHLAEAMQALEDLAPYAGTFDTVDQMETMSKPATALGVVWGREEFSHKGDGFFQFILPKEGSPVWINTLCVSSHSKNPDAAHAFINFILRPDILARISESSGTAVAGLPAQELLPDSLRNNTVVYPPAEFRYRFEAEKPLPPEADALHRRWLKIQNSLQ